ncbi:MAG: hypothetical protein OER87_00925 [Gammaproteobacteria bacterium]|nr:hypothetical protein [Gammaproteobacteria bacterium]
MSRYEAMRTDRSNWKLGLVYHCAADPRIVVRQLLPVGWTWNFGHRLVYPAILIAVFSFLALPVVAWWYGVRSTLALGLVILATLVSIMIVAHRMAQDPDA